MRKKTFLDKLKLDEGWFSLIALSLAFMTVVWSIEGAHWTKGLEILPQAGIVALLLGFVLAEVRFVPGLLAHSFMLSVGMVFIGVLAFPFVDSLSQDADWSKRLGSVVLRTVKWSQGGFSRYDPLVFLVSLGMLIWVSGYAITWLVFRRRQVWMAIAVMGSILIGNLSYNPPNPLNSFFIFLVSSLLLVVRFNAFLNEARWRRLRIPYKHELWQGAMLVGGLLVLLITAVAFVAPSSSQVEPLGKVFSNINGPWQQLQNGLPGFGSASSGQGREGRQPTNYNNLSKSFTIGGPITLSNDPVLRVTGNDTNYLQVAAMDKYDGKGWIATYQDVAAGNWSDKVFNQLSLAPGQSLPTSTDQGRGLYKLTVTPLIPGFNPVLTSGELVTVNRAALLAYHWEHIIIKSPLDRINPKPISDGITNTRIVIIDESSGQTIPPDLLPLVKMLKEAQAGTNATGSVSALTFNYSGSAYLLQRKNNAANQAVKVDNFTWELNGWSYKLPSENQLKALNLSPGGASDESGRLKVQLIEKRQPDKVITLPASRVSLGRDGTTYSFTVNTTDINSDAAVQSRFEVTSAGQKIKAEIERLNKDVPGNKISYIIRNGLPYSLDFDGYEPNYDDLIASTTQQPPAPGESYTTQALRYRSDEASLRGAGQSYPTWVKNRYLDLPEVSQRVKDLARNLTAHLNNPYDKAKAIEDYLRKIPYSLNAPFTPDGRDPVDFFLFDSKLGYCVHYSTAFNVMLRSLGIPTREMTGFNGGEFDPATGTTLVRSSAAHAWSQVYFPGYGWIDFEPTPGRSVITRPSDPSAVLPLPTPTPVAVLVTPTTVEGSTPIEGQNPADETATSGEVLTTSTPESNNLALLIWLGGLVGLVGLSLVVYQANQRWLRTQLRLPDVSPMTLYERMLRTARRSGLKPVETMTPYEFAAFLGRKLPSVRGEVRAFTDGYVRQRYGPQAVEDELRRELLELETARVRVAQVEAAGGEPSTQELWAAFKSQTMLLHSAPQIRQMWESYQLGLIAYSRRQRLTRLTPGFFYTLYSRLGGLRRWVQNIKSKG
ncbi:MAG: transglutaminase domain-containing protein [Chloroflexota bacterium]